MGSGIDTIGPEFDDLISAVRALVHENDAELEEIFDVYAQEARFSRTVFDDDFRRLPGQAAILEVGAGMMLLSCQLVREGFSVTALEPVGEGFSHFSRLQEIVRHFAAKHSIEPDYLECRAEDIVVKNIYDFAFSSNVMEHVDDIGLVLHKVYNSMREGASYRFICPNYAFPYEPHFNMPTLGSKSLTERFMKRRIEQDSRLPDPAGTWESLNWITPRKVKKACREQTGVSARFDSDIFNKYLDRAFNDPLFQQRRGGMLSGFLRVFRALGFFRLTRFVPVQLLPVMDCSISKIQGQSA
jgi:SAM-dependent methyltransferase